MSIKSKVLATAATMTFVVGVGTAGVLGTAATANAATPSCGPGCVDIFSQEFGTHGSPTFLVDTYRQRDRIGTKIILFRASNDDPAEDFYPENEGTVADFFEAGLVSAAFALHYGCLAGADDDDGVVVGTGNFTDCFGLESFAPGTFNCPATATADCQAQFNDPAFEIEYAPDGADSGLCVGVASTATQEEHVTLQECGASAKTVWAIDLYDNVFDAFVTGYAPLINGSDTNFSQPYVLTYPSSGYPTDSSRPALQVDTLSGFTQGFPPQIIDNYPTIDDDQLWGADFGD